MQYSVRRDKGQFSIDLVGELEVSANDIDFARVCRNMKEIAAGCNLFDDPPKDDRLLTDDDEQCKGGAEICLHSSKSPEVLSHSRLRSKLENLGVYYLHLKLAAGTPMHSRYFPSK